MNQKASIEGVLAQFERSANGFHTETGGLFCRISSEYKGPEQSQNLRWKRATIYYNAYAIEFLYTAHGVLGTVNSILSCNVYPDKSDCSAGIPLPLLSDYCGMDVEVPLCIPFITNEQAMIQAFRYIGDTVKNLQPVILETCCDARLLDALRNRFSDELWQVFRVKASDLEKEPLRRSLAEFFAFRFSGGAFLTALREDYIKAAKQLSQAKTLSGYEKRMQRIWLKREPKISMHLSGVSKNAKVFNGYGISEIERKELLAAFVSWLALFPILSGAYLGLYWLLVWFESRDSIYLMGPQYYFPYCFLAGAVSTIVLSWFTRFFFYKLLFKKDYAQYCEMENIQPLSGINKFMRGLRTVLIAGSIVLCVLCANRNINFKQEGFEDNSQFAALSGEYYLYSDVESVYYKPNRVNGSGETIERPSYVIVLRGGKEIDLYGIGNMSDYSETLLPFFRDKGIPIK